MGLDVRTVRLEIMNTRTMKSIASSAGRHPMDRGVRTIRITTTATVMEATSADGADQLRQEADVPIVRTRIMNTSSTRAAM